MAKLTYKKSAAGNLDSEKARTKLETGHWFPQIREPEDSPPLTNDELAELWQAIGPELSAEFATDHPGERCWAQWAFDLLPHDPRRRVDDDPDLPATSAEVPTGEPWHPSGGYESSFAYLRRRGLLGVDELASIRTKHDGARILESHRIELERIAPKYRDNARMSGAELADFLSIFPDVELLPAERARAEPFILAT